MNESGLPGLVRSLAALSLAAVVGCGSGGGGGSGDAAIGLGAGGAKGTGGEGGMLAGPGSGGAGGGSSGGAFTCNVPSCLLDVFASCVPQGTCKTQSASTSSTICWSNGVKQVASVDLASMSSTVRVTKPDGSTCWSYEIPYSSSGVPDKLTVTYKDGAGRAFATLTYEKATSTATVACADGRQERLDSACNATIGGSGVSGSDPDQCQKGVCP